MEEASTCAAITDHGNMYGVVEFYKTAKAADINPVIGCEIYVAPNSRFDRETSHGEDRYYHLILLAENNTGSITFYIFAFFFQHVISTAIYYIPSFFDIL